MDSCEFPAVRTGDWIVIGEWQCIVSAVYRGGLRRAVGEVVFDHKKPTNLDFTWSATAGNFAFAERGDQGRSAARYGRLEGYVWQLQQWANEEGWS